MRYVIILIKLLCMYVCSRNRFGSLIIGSTWASGIREAVTMCARHYVKLTLYTMIL